MGEVEYTRLMSYLLIANIPPYIALFFLFLRWRHFARRRWVRNAFTVVSGFTILFVVFRIAGFVMFEYLEIRLATSAFFVLGGYLMAIMFGLATRVMEKRLAEMKRVDTEKQKTSDILEAVMIELRSAITDKSHSARR